MAKIYIKHEWVKGFYGPLVNFQVNNMHHEDVQSLFKYPVVRWNNRWTVDVPEDELVLFHLQHP